MVQLHSLTSTTRLQLPHKSKLPITSRNKEAQASTPTTAANCANTVIGPHVRSDSGNLKIANPRKSNVDVISLIKQGRLQEAVCGLDIWTNSSTYGVVLGECGDRNALSEGRMVHAHLANTGLGHSLYLVNLLLIMYAKCGSVIDAQRLFENFAKRDAVSWSAMIAAYAQQGNLQSAVQLIAQMHLEGIKVNNNVYTAILLSCSFFDLVEEALHFIISLSADYEHNLEAEHYSCLIPLLSQWGWFDEAEDLSNRMPSEADVIVWTKFFSAWKVHREPLETNYGDLQVKVLDLSLSDDLANEVMLSDNNVKCMNDIYSELETLNKKVNLAQKRPPMHENAQNSRKHSILYHSERLAIAYGLMSTLDGTSLRVIKNLRVCDDCHTFTKYVSKIHGREIHMRDANRFHHFKNGECSCGDYW